MTREEAIRILDYIPTIGEQVDAIDMAIEALQTEVVLCKDCKWQEECSQFVVLHKFCGVYQEISFCSHGERREE